MNEWKEELLLVEKRYSNGRYKRPGYSVEVTHSGWHRGGTEAGGWDGWLGEGGGSGKQPPSVVARRKRGKNGERTNNRVKVSLKRLKSVNRERKQATGLRSSREQILDDHGQVQSGRQSGRWQWAVVGRTVDEEGEAIQGCMDENLLNPSPCKLDLHLKTRYCEVAATARAPESRGAAAVRYLEREKERERGRESRQPRAGDLGFARLGRMQDLERQIDAHCSDFHVAGEAEKSEAIGVQKRPKAGTSSNGLY